MLGKNVRQASHAGSWYLADKKRLDDQLESWLEPPKDIIKIKALIGPHAGLSYCGKTGGTIYRYLNDKNRKEELRVFLLGPSHHFFLSNIALSELSEYVTPLGNIRLDRETIEKLKKEGNFSILEKEAEEDEHSLEMHLPFLFKTLQTKIKLVPLLVGSMDPKMHDYYAKILAKYFDEPNTIFIASSDFCHWGSRFRYQNYNAEDGEIYKSIENLDRKGMNLIEAHDANGFFEYLEKTKNTICGRNPISILLRVIEKSIIKKDLKTRFLSYSQSSQVTSMSDSSVSYAGSITFSE